MPSITSSLARTRLPNRRPSHTETLRVDGQAFTATVGFDPRDNSPRELFLVAGKEGSMLNALLADAAVAVYYGASRKTDAASGAHKDKTSGFLPFHGAGSAVGSIMDSVVSRKGVVSPSMPGPSETLSALEQRLAERSLATPAPLAYRL